MNPCYTSASINCSCLDSSVTESDAFWFEILRDYEIERPVVLPTDRQRISINNRTYRVWSVPCNFDSKLTRALLNNALVTNTTLDYLVFTCYYVFLFKLTNGERDLCVGRNIGVQCQSELHE